MSPACREDGVGVMAKNRPSNQTLTVDVGLIAAEGVETPSARVYLFDRTGDLVDSKPLAKGPMTFSMTDTRRHRVVVGPDLPTAARSVADLAAELARAGAIVRDVIPTAAARVSVRVPATVYLCWWQTCILVRGSVRKQTGPGVFRPICDGVVQIFQVDLGCTLDRLASFTDEPAWLQLLIDVLAGLERDALIDRIRLVKNLPDPPPDAFHETRVITEETIRSDVGRAELASASKLTSAAPSSRLAAVRSSRPRAPQMASAKELSATLRDLPLAAAKEAILANKAILTPFLCWLIPDEWFCWQELGEATIQSDGSFSAEICLWCPDDNPDLYFEVVQTAGGIEREISDPQIACSTYYDYDGSRPVVITVDDPSAVACNDPAPRPIPGKEYYVWPTAIGNTDLRLITGLEAAAGGPLQGQVGASPLGGTLALQVEFDPRLKSDGIASYYRWSYRFDGDVGWTPISAPVTHRYKTVTFPPLQIHLHSVNLGPHGPIGGQQNLFDVPDPYPGDGWVNINDPWDRPFAYFDSTDNHQAPFTYADALPRRSGMCTLLLELFDAAGNLVQCGNNGLGGPFVFVLPDLAGPPTEYTSVLGPNNISPSGQLTFRLRIDNNDTYANVDSVATASSSVVPGSMDDLCGIRHFASVTENVTIGFRASHPNNFLTWHLDVVKGAVGSIDGASGNSSSPPQPPNPFVRTAAALLGGCPAAAFALNLYTWATATDGYSRQSQYDRSDTFAFALVSP